MFFLYRKNFVPCTLAGGILLSACQLPGSLDSNSHIYNSIPESPAPAANELKRENELLVALDKVDYQELDTEKSVYLTIDSTAQVMPFKTGKSYVKGVVLPDDLSRATLKVEAIAGKTLFVPTLLILKQNFRPSRVIAPSVFSYEPSTVFSPDRLQTSFAVDRSRGSDTAAEKYLLIFTTDKDKEGETTLQSRADQYAKARSLADPRLPSPVARHAVTGLLRISAHDVQLTTAADASWEGLDGGGDAEIRGMATPDPAADSLPNLSRVTDTAVVGAGSDHAGNSDMLPETEEMYHQLIRKNVDAGDIDKAWRLVQEGEKAGSVTVRRTFMRALDRKK